MPSKVVYFRNKASDRWLYSLKGDKHVEKVEASPASWEIPKAAHMELKWIVHDDGIIETPEGRKMCDMLPKGADHIQTWGKPSDKAPEIWELKPDGEGFNIHNKKTERRLYARKEKSGPDGFGALKKHGFQDQIWLMIEEKPEKKDGEEIPWDEIAAKAKSAGISMKQAALDMGVAAKERIDAIPWDDISAEATRLGVSMAEAAKSIPWEDMAKKAMENAKAMAEAVKKKVEEIPWDEIAEKAKATGVSMKDAAVSMGVSMKEAAEDIPWDEIAAKAKAAGVSMKEAAASLPWEDWGKRLDKLKDKMEDLAEDLAEKAEDLVEKAQERGWCSCCGGTNDKETEIVIQDSARKLEANER